MKRTVSKQTHEVLFRLEVYRYCQYLLYDDNVGKLTSDFAGRHIIYFVTALNGTTTTTKDQQAWKTKKGYGPIIVALSLALLLGLSFYAGRHSDEMRMTNVVASSSSSLCLCVAEGWDSCTTV